MLPRATPVPTALNRHSCSAAHAHHQRRVTAGADAAHKLHLAPESQSRREHTQHTPKTAAAHERAALRALADRVCGAEHAEGGVDGVDAHVKQRGAAAIVASGDALQDKRGLHRVVRGEKCKRAGTWMLNVSRPPSNDAVNTAEEMGPIAPTHGYEDGTFELQESGEGRGGKRDDTASRAAASAGDQCMQCRTAHRTPAASAAAIIRRHSSSASAMGFSTSTCSPRLAAAMAAAACAMLGVTMTTPSTCRSVKCQCSRRNTNATA